MPLDKHSFLNEFPNHHHTIRHLKMNDAHFARLFEQYNELDHEVFRIESGETPSEDAYVETKKKERMQLKDALFAMVKKEEAAQ